VAAGAIVEGAILGNAVEVHETAHIAEGSVVGDRSIIGRNAVVANNVKVYPFKNVEPGSTVRPSCGRPAAQAPSLAGTAYAVSPMSM